MSGIQLFSGRIFNPCEITKNSYTLEDIAHGLMNQPRFSGHTLLEYNVAQHCIIMSRWFRKRNKNEEAKWALLHEVSEGLGFCDVPTPIKYLPELQGYRKLSKSVDAQILEHFGLIGKMPKEVKDLDTRMFFAEAKVLLRNVPDSFFEVDTSDLIVKPYRNKYDSKKYFLQEYKILFGP